MPDCGEPFDICAGDAVWFPAYTTGTWEITETLRKTYVIIGFRPEEKLLASLSRRLAAFCYALGRFLTSRANKRPIAKPL